MIHVTLVDSRDEDTQLFSGEVDWVPDVDDSVTMGSDTAISLWRVVNRTWAVENGKFFAALLLMEPVGGEWDGSADRYLETVAK